MNMEIDREAALDAGPWKRNLIVCVFGSFTTIVGMTLLLPFLPLYVEQLGVTDHAAVVQWSGIAYGATFFTAALTAPLWGRLADRYGRKLMLIRASLGMAVAMSLIGMAHNVYELVGLRLLTGLLGGYASGSTVLVAAQTPKARSGWAIGVLSAGIMAGSLVGPLIGGVLPGLIGIRATFFLIGGVIFFTFLGTTFLIREEARPKAANGGKSRGGWSLVPDKRPVIAMWGTGLLLMIANMSIEPIITVYVAQLVETPQVTFVAGLVMSAAAFGSLLSSSHLGKLADRVGHWRIINVCLAASALLLIPQAFVVSGWQLILLRFLMGLALGGLLPCIASVIRHNVPDTVTGSMLGYSISAQYAGQVIGPLAGGFIGGHIGMRAVFLGTSVLMALGAIANFIVEKKG
ncbi:MULTISPECIES: MFS transporter [unclassified Bradyrhizobium]|uniref:MFS transporter n=1 Tax=unclassified Bradyrhizobium TaxID=2631580 RepID=UPI001BAC6E41|nr:MULTISPECIES: MFS transporter [unclassified Bradyrhizobium]MBR1207157.1 MFS transporter [Bradyrhizobium sp. AUGA SZCCT0124]MBR1313696.1 MFS transporter [Bradyrhizobium sp. AUGA SZCCT0051]MBR1343207.1 MFS transporter [Bradyrhizobium sp. AUGA SZCCT0105]MBR1357373.1 MFS transporter [Bradyrhizobium sp. AUGA SZCCT0045]